MNHRLARLLFATTILLAPLAIRVHATVPTSIAAVPGAAAPASTASAAAAIAKLEERLFELTYSSETDDARLARLEKFVFGTRQSGTVQARLTRLQSSITANAPAPLPTASQPASNQSASNQSASSSHGTSQSSSTASDAVTGNSQFAYGNYPRVTELEQDMLGTTYMHEALPDRLSRLEKKAFGSPSTSDDLCARVDSLDQYAERHKIFKDHHDPLVNNDMASPTGRFGIFDNSAPAYHRSYQPTFSMLDAPGDTPAADDDGPKPPYNPFINGVTGTDQRLSAIEEFTYGHNYATRPVQDRLARLEKRLVPYQHNLAAKDVPTRVNNLWSILSVANTLQSSPTAAHQGNMLAAAGFLRLPLRLELPAAAPALVPHHRRYSASRNPTHHSWLHQMGKTIASQPSENFGPPGYEQ